MRRGSAALAAACAGLVLAAAVPSSATDVAATHGPRPQSTFTNPVSAGFADTFADPSVVRGKDGWWYAVGTTDPLSEGERTRHLLPTARSSDLVDWEFVGDAFAETSLPSWAAAGASLWAPDIRYVDGEYRMYYVVTETTTTPQAGDGAVGVATAPTPTGPWTDSGAPVVEARPGENDDFLWTFDPTHVRGADGTQYLYYGSYYGGIEVVPLDKTGTRAQGPPTRVAIDNKYEGAYVVQRDGWWYLFTSSANCCAGPTTGYSVHVGRSRSLTGPFVDREGARMDVSRAGGTPVIAPNGNRWVGTGHNAVVTDLAGQDWLAYHAIDRADPYLDEDGGINERPMLIDRLDWVDGWPTVRGGAWASDSPEPVPVTSPVTGFDHGLGARGWRPSPGWTVGDRAADDAGPRAVATVPGTITRSVGGAGAVRVEADVRAGGAGLVIELRGGHRAQATVDDSGVLSLAVTDRRGKAISQRDVPSRAWAPNAWHSLALTVQDGVAHADLSDARLGDPLAQNEMTVPASATGSAGAVAVAHGAEIDNLSVTPVARERPPEPALQPGTLDAARSDEFDEPLGDRWRGVRDPAARVEDGALRWPVQEADISGPGGTAALLLQQPPPGDWTVQTLVDVSALGTDTVRNYQQGGIVVRVDDDHWVRLSAVAIWNTRQTEFGVEQPSASGVSMGGTIVGPPDALTWLRVDHRTASDGAHLLTARTSRDGERWVQGGTWTLPAGSDLEVGLFSGGGVPGGAAPPAEIGFDHLRWYLP